MKFDRLVLETVNFKNDSYYMGDNVSKIRETYQKIDFQFSGYVYHFDSDGNNPDKVVEAIVEYNFRKLGVGYKDVVDALKFKYPERFLSTDSV